MPPYPFIAPEKERPVSSVVMRQKYGTANIGSELIQVKLINAAHRVLGIESAVAEEFPNSTMKTVRSRFGNNIDYATKHPAKLCLIVMRIDLEFLDVIENRWYGVGAAEALLIIQSVQQKKIAAVGLTVDRRKRE